MIMDQINPPAAVQEDTQSVQYWHKKALEADKVRSNSSLDHAEALYYVNEGEGYKELGFDSLGEYVFSSFGKSKGWGNKLISIHKKFVIELGQTKEDLKKVTFGKISKLVSVVDEDNVDEMLEFAETATQKEVDAQVKESKGLEANETKDSEEMVTMRFKMPSDVAPVIRDSLELAREEYSEHEEEEYDIPDFKALEIMAANYALSRPISGKWEDGLNELFDSLGKLYNIDISWEERDG